MWSNLRPCKPSQFGSAMQVEITFVHMMDSSGNPVTLTKKQIFETYIGNDDLPHVRAMAPTYLTQDGVPVFTYSTGKYETMGGELLTEIVAEPVKLTNP